MKPDSELVEHYRQVLTETARHVPIQAFAHGRTVAMVREAADAHADECRGCATCERLRDIVSFVLAYALTFAQTDLLRKMYPPEADAGSASDSNGMP